MVRAPVMRENNDDEPPKMGTRLRHESRPAESLNFSISIFACTNVRRICISRKVRPRQSVSGSLGYGGRLRNIGVRFLGRRQQQTRYETCYGVYKQGVAACHQNHQHGYVEAGHYDESPQGGDDGSQSHAYGDRDEYQGCGSYDGKERAQGYRRQKARKLFGDVQTGIFDKQLYIAPYNGAKGLHRGGCVVG